MIGTLVEELGLPADFIVSYAPQGSDEWLAARRGVRTASRFKDARDRLKSGGWGKKAIAYAMDLARERVGGAAPSAFVNAAMRLGTEMEPKVRQLYELREGVLVDEVGFAFTEDKLFGVSVDGLVGDDGIWECKVMVSSDTLFTAMVGGDITEYTDQCVGGMWLLHRKWVDLTLYCADLDLLKVIRITRNDDEIDALVKDLMAHEELTREYESKLRSVIAQADPAQVKPAPAAAPTAPVAEVAFGSVPADIF